VHEGRCGFEFSEAEKGHELGPAARGCVAWVCRVALDAATAPANLCRLETGLSSLFRNFDQDKCSTHGTPVGPDAIAIGICPDRVVP